MKLLKIFHKKSRLLKTFRKKIVKEMYRKKKPILFQISYVDVPVRFRRRIEKRCFSAEKESCFNDVIRVCVFTGELVHGYSLLCFCWRNEVYLVSVCLESVFCDKTPCWRLYILCLIQQQHLVAWPDSCSLYIGLQMTV